MNVKKLCWVFLLIMVLVSPVHAEEPAQKTAEETPFSMPSYATVSLQKGTLNLRATMKKNGKVLAKLPKETVLLLLDQDAEGSDDWTKVMFRDKTGYVMSEYLTPLIELPFAPLKEGDRDPSIMDLKLRLVLLKYLPQELKSDIYFDALLAEAVRLFERTHKLEVTGMISPEIHALMLWGDPLPNAGEPLPLPVSAQAAMLEEQQGEATAVQGAATGEEKLTAKIGIRSKGHTIINGGAEIRNDFVYTTTIKGGVPPYKIKVQRKGPGGTQLTTVNGPEFSYTCNNGYEYSTFHLILVVTDAAGTTVTAHNSIAFVSADWDAAPAASAQTGSNNSGLTAEEEAAIAAGAVD